MDLCSFSLKPKSNDLILHNSNSTNSILCNRKYPKNKRDAAILQKIQTNGGIMIVNQVCDLDYL